MMLVWLLIGCSEEEQKESSIQKQESMRMLRRWSLDITGKLPSVEELRQVQENPNRLEEKLDLMLESPLWNEMLVRQLNEQWHTRVDLFSVVPDDFVTGDYSIWYSFNRSVGEEPLRLMAHIATSDLPWTDVVLSDYSFANEQLAEMYPVSYPQGESGWQKVQYTDGRPPVGVLATNGLWWRYITDSLNMNRMRAATLMRLLLCDDLLSRPISFEASAHALEDATTALQQDLACLNCHASLDPLASALFGFYWIEEGNPLEAVSYHPERELLGQQYIGVEPAWFGQPIGSLADVGTAIVSDPRFGQCAVQSFAELYYRRDMDSDDFTMLQSHVQEFVDGDLRIKPLVKSILLSDEYRTAEELPNGVQARTLRMMSPYQLSTSISDWNDQTWMNTDGPLLDHEYRAMMGGVDGLQTYAPQLYPSTTTALTLQRFAQYSATQIVEQSIALDTGLLQYVDERTSPGDPAFAQQLDHLRLQLHAIEPTEEWREEITQLWSACTQEDSEKLGWICVLSAMIQDLDFVSY